MRGIGEDYVELPSSFDSMWLILDAMVTKAHSSCASRSASSASLAAWAADGFRREGVVDFRSFDRCQCTGRWRC